MLAQTGIGTNTKHTSISFVAATAREPGNLGFWKPEILGIPLAKHHYCSQRTQIALGNANLKNIYMDLTDNHTVKECEQSHVEEASNLLTKFSLRGKYETLAAHKLDEVYVLQDIALLGQATVLYAAPNTGKTLISLALLKAALMSGRIQADKVFYINADDSLNGAVDKLGLTEEQNFHYLVPGHEGFTVDKIRLAMTKMIDDDATKGVVLILDTLKKFVDLMDKTTARSFSNLVRSFVSTGGTVIAFAHTNKNLGADGKPRYGGTSDIVDDFDCAYIMSEIPTESHEQIKLIEFQNVKARGAVKAYVYCSYANGANVPYSEKLASVSVLAEKELAQLRLKVQMARDADVIEAASNCMNDGISQKMALSKEVGTLTGASRSAIFKVLDTYCGTDQTCHLWSVRIGARGAKNYTLLKPCIAPVNDDDF